MPEAALDQDDGSFAGEHNVRHPGQRADMQAIPQAPAMERTTQRHFRLGILSSYARHHLGARRGIDDVNQSYPLALISRPGKAVA
jgi:hypothetical protein